MQTPGFSSVLIAVLILIDISTELKCPDANTTEYVKGHCMFVELSKVLSYEAALARCRRLNEKMFKWHPPKLDSKDKLREMAIVLRRLDKSQQIGWLLWIGLKRDETTHQTGKKAWEDLKSWKWAVDKSSLADKRIGRWNLNDSSFFDSPDQKRCALAFLSRRKNTDLYWILSWCDISKSSVDSIVKGAARISVCESSIEEPSSPSKSYCSSSASSSFQWEWLVLALCIVLLVVSLVVLAIVLRLRAKSKHGMFSLKHLKNKKRSNDRKFGKGWKKGASTGTSSMLGTERSSARTETSNVSNRGQYENVQPQSMSTDQTSTATLSAYGR